MNERQMVKTHLEALAVRVRGKGGTGPWTTSRATSGDHHRSGTWGQPRPGAPVQHG
jgi:hypothetical protein